MVRYYIDDGLRATITELLSLLRHACSLVILQTLGPPFIANAILTIELEYKVFPISG